MSVLLFVNDQHAATSLMKSRPWSLAVWPTMTKDWDGEDGRHLWSQAFAARQFSEFRNLTMTSPFPLEKPVLDEALRRFRSKDDIVPVLGVDVVEAT